MFTIIVDPGASYFWRSPDGKQWYLKASYPFGEQQVLPHFSDNPEAARLLEDEIERRGLQMPYMDALLSLCPLVGYAGINNPEDHNAWLLIRTTPEQRARAFLEVAGE